MDVGCAQYSTVCSVSTNHMAKEAFQFLIFVMSGARSAERVPHGLVNKSKYDRPGPTRHDPLTLLTGLYVRDCASDFHAVFTGG